jgi:hypothetical protein
MTVNSLESRPLESQLSAAAQRLCALAWKTTVGGGEIEFV